jgi:hypothetical protein
VGRWRSRSRFRSQSRSSLHRCPAQRPDSSPAGRRGRTCCRSADRPGSSSRSRTRRCRSRCRRRSRSAGRSRSGSRWTRAQGPPRRGRSEPQAQPHHLQAASTGPLERSLPSNRGCRLSHGGSVPRADLRATMIRRPTAGTTWR